jgi:hypothetical protein
MGVIKAIETKYAGYRFRSRLEARWAVFMDAVGMAWDYEIQGFHVPTPIGNINYLPDFWLREGGQWGEVKGHLFPDQVPRVAALAAGMSFCGGADTVFLGNIPRLGSCRWPVQLHYHKDSGLWALGWDPKPGCPMDRPHLRVPPTASEDTATLLTEGFMSGVPEWALPGLEKARAARFEWGESG